MEAEDIIYIVATIIIFVVSIISKPRKKAKPEPKNLDELEYTLNDFEKLLERSEEFIDDQEEEEEKEEEQYSAVTKKRRKAVTKAHTHHITEKKENEKVVVENEHEDGFDVKSAVIYSSILERKKYRR